MKKVISLLVILLMLTMLWPPQKVQAHGGPGWFLPGLIIGGAIGLSMAYPRYYYPRPYYDPYYPPPAYYYPPPAYSYPPPAYAPPPPATVPRGNVNQAPPETGGRVFIYPRKGQGPEQQAKDSDECRTWAINQSGYDATKPPPVDTPQEQLIQKSEGFFRALAACMDGRGYTIR